MEIFFIYSIFLTSATFAHFINYIYNCIEYLIENNYCFEIKRNNNNQVYKLTK